jgi:hypothetical protein
VSAGPIGKTGTHDKQSINSHEYRRYSLFSSHLGVGIPSPQTRVLDSTQQSNRNGERGDAFVLSDFNFNYAKITRVFASTEQVVAKLLPDGKVLVVVYFASVIVTLCLFSCIQIDDAFMLFCVMTACSGFLNLCITIFF